MTLARFTKSTPPATTPVETSNEVITYALKYIALGWPVLQLHGIVDGRCACCDPSCASPGKHPNTRNGVKDATLNPKVVEGFSARSNLGIAMGGGRVAVDVDFKHDGLSHWAELERVHGPFPATVRWFVRNGVRASDTKQSPHSAPCH